MKRIGVLGLGWLGKPLANRLLTEGYEISGTTTSLGKIERLRKLGLNAQHLEIHQDHVAGDLTSFLLGIDLIILNFPPKRVSEIESIYPAQIEKIIAEASNNLRVIFISSTSVYGNADGEVLESDKLFPEKSSGKAVLAAEGVLKDYFQNNLTIIRFAGLIGPDRHPGRFLSGKKNVSNSEAPVNLIHQLDCIGLILSVIKKNAFGEVFNGSASHHPARKLFYQLAAENLGLEPPSFSGINDQQYKVVSNDKSRKYLDYQYQFDDPTKMFI